MGVEFSEVGESVLIEILVSVVDPILVGIGVCWVGAEIDFIKITQPVPVRVHQCGISFVELDFVGIDKAIPVGVRQVGVGLVGIDFIAVT